MTNDVSGEKKYKMRIPIKVPIKFNNGVSSEPYMLCEGEVDKRGFEQEMKEVSERIFKENNPTQSEE